MQKFTNTGLVKDTIHKKGRGQYNNMMIQRRHNNTMPITKACFRSKTSRRGGETISDTTAEEAKALQLALKIFRALDFFDDDGGAMLEQLSIGGDATVIARTRRRQPTYNLTTVRGWR
eukprot:scaffold367_cov202-Alexandrium_tamarense.AAC.12